VPVNRAVPLAAFKAGARLRQAWLPALEIASRGITRQALSF